MPHKRAENILQRFEIPALIATPICFIILTIWQVDQSALISMLVALACVILIFASFESSRPSLRQIMPTVVLAALAAAGRIIFGPIPNVQPVSAITIIAGIVFGRRSGFMVGALSMLISNFWLGQGPWTPWQMYGFGLMGYLAGILADRNVFKKRLPLYIYAFLAPILEYGFLLNSWYLIGYVHPITWEAAVLAYGGALPLDIAHALSCVVFLFMLYEPWCKKLERIKHKYDLAPSVRESMESTS